MGRIFEVRKHAMFARWNRMAKQFARVGKDIAIAVRTGGTDPNANPALRRAIQNARSYNMPKDKVDAAIKQVPQEARFHGLKGDIMVYQKRYQDAIGSYDEAIKHDDNYYDYYLGRGVAHSRLNQTALARQDLQRSNKLLPTAAAANELGKLALNDGNRAEAKRLFGKDPSLPEPTVREYLTPWTAAKAEKQFLARFGAVASP